MKKNNVFTTKIFSIILPFLAVFIFFSCSGVIFDTIRDEVKLADAKISGDIQNIVRYKENIYVSTGKIYTRNVSLTSDLAGNSKTDDETITVAADVKTELSSFTSPSGYVYSLAADSSNLYALSTVFEEDDDGYNVPSKRTLWSYDGTKWKQIWEKSYNTSDTVLFCTNTLDESNRHAYFRYGTTVYELDGSELGESGMTTGETDNTTVPTTSVMSCAVLGSTVYFSSAYAMTSNETSEDDSTYIYRSNGDTVYYSTDGSNWNSADLNCDTIYSLAITADYLLAGTASGIVHTPLTNNIPSSGTADFNTNADSTLSSYYEVPSLLVIDSLQAETSATIFATCLTSSSSASLNNVGLWSYFASEGEWNRE